MCEYPQTTHHYMVVVNVFKLPVTMRLLLCSVTLELT